MCGGVLFIPIKTINRAVFCKEMQTQTKISEFRENPDLYIAYSFHSIGPEKLYHFYEILLTVKIKGI